MTPTANTAPNSAVILERIEALRCDVAKLQATVELQSQTQDRFVLEYTKAHAELEAKVNRVDEKSDRAHERVDTINKMVWAIALPVILGALGFLWAVASHAVTIGAP